MGAAHTSAQPRGLSIWLASSEIREVSCPVAIPSKKTISCRTIETNSIVRTRYLRRVAVTQPHRADVGGTQ